MGYSFQEVLSMSKDVDGFLTDREGWLLFQLARRTQKGAIVEIGSWQGKSTIWLGCGTKSAYARKLYAIDPHTGSEEHQRDGKKVWTFQKFEHNIRHAGLKDIIIPIVDFAEKARQSFDQPIGMLFIDGAHDYASVKKDYELWAPLVMEGGVVAFHDTQWEGVQKVCDDVFLRDGFSKVYFQDSICYGVKASKCAVWDKFRAKRMLELKNVFSDICTRKAGKLEKKLIKEWVKFQRALLMIM